jgi:hypothetical protein
MRCRAGARWQDLPEKYASPSTCWRRLQMWEEQDVWLDIWRAWQRVATLDQRSPPDWSEAFAGGSFAPAKKVARGRENQAREKHEVDDGRWRDAVTRGASTSPQVFNSNPSVPPGEARQLTTPVAKEGG